VARVVNYSQHARRFERQTSNINNEPANASARLNLLSRQGAQDPAEIGPKVSTAGILRLQRRVELLSVVIPSTPLPASSSLMAFYVPYLAASGIFNSL